MEAIILKIGYFVLIIGSFIIRYPHEQRNKANLIIDSQKNTLGLDFR